MSVRRRSIQRTVSEEDLARLKRERDEANKRYADALTLLDAAKQRPPEVPAPPPWPDEHQITPLNQLWTLVPADPPMGAGWRARIAEIAWRLVAPIFERQQAFNSALVDHINRNLIVERETRKSIETTIQLAREQFTALVTFEWHLMHFLQQLTPYIDAADRESLALMRRITEDNEALLERVTEQVDGFAGGLAGVGDHLLKHVEATSAREQRYEARASSLPILQQAVQTLKREMERLGASLAASGSSPARATALLASGAVPVSGPSSQALPSFGSAIESYKYLCFEEKFRGAQEEIANRVGDYLPDFAGAADVLDLGCGRGEFLERLREAGISGRGVDLNHEMVEICRARGLAVDEGEGIAYLNSLQDGALGGLFAAQVIEHLRPEQLLRLIELGYHKLRPGSAIVLETINPSCWFAFFESYLRDITHVQPIHPDTLKYLLLAGGFQEVEIRYRAPLPEGLKLQRLATAGDFGEVFNDNVEKINRLLFGHLDYAAVARRL